MDTPKIGIKQTPINLRKVVKTVKDEILPEVVQEVQTSKSVVPVYSRYGKQAYTPPGYSNEMGYSPFLSFKLSKRRFGRG